MEMIEYRDVIDKSAWGTGPWSDEPDKMQWPDEATGLPCLIVRNRYGALCGYVGVPSGHPWHGRGYDDVTADVHGGLTFAGPCSPEEDETSGICHIPAVGEPDDVWWLGFDCAHAFDATPGMGAFVGDQRLPSEFQDVYRDFAYVRGEVEGLARQAAAAVL